MSRSSWQGTGSCSAWPAIAAWMRSALARAESKPRRWLRPVLARKLGVLVDEPEVEAGGETDAGIVKRSQRTSHLGQLIRSRQILSGHLPSDDERRDETRR